MKRTANNFTVIVLVFLTASITALPTTAAIKAWVHPSAADRCSVCGMFVSKYPAWTAEIVFNDGSYAVFDGAKDMFTYYFDMRKYSPSKKREDIASMYVMDYYAVAFIDARSAFYVDGSDVRGPMGKELVAFAAESDAREFNEDHKGKAVLPFGAVTPEILKDLR
jgi:nitrous oxide reductase accessory protein NosL